MGSFPLRLVLLVVYIRLSLCFLWSLFRPVNMPSNGRIKGIRESILEQARNILVHESFIEILNHSFHLWRRKCATLHRGALERQLERPFGVWSTVKLALLCVSGSMNFTGASQSTCDSRGMLPCNVLDRSTDLGLSPTLPLRIALCWHIVSKM